MIYLNILNRIKVLVLGKVIINHYSVIVKTIANDYILEFFYIA